MNMKRLLSLVAFFATLQASAQQVNPVPDYVFRNQMSVGRGTVTDTAAYFSIGPRYGANKGFMPPIVGDTATFSSGKRNGLLIFSVQKNKFLYWDSVRVQWSDMAGSSGTYITGSGITGYVPQFSGTTTIDTSGLFTLGSRLGIGTSSFAYTSATSSIELNGTSGGILGFKRNDSARGYLWHTGSDMELANTVAGAISFNTNSSTRGSISSAGVWRLHNLAGTGDRVVVASSNGTLSASTSVTGLVDTTTISTRAWRQKGDDSLGAIIATKGTGTVTSVATGFGLSGGTITTTGTLLVDTLNIATRAWRQKGLDSLAALEVSGSGTTNYVPKFTAASTIGNSQIVDNAASGVSIGAKTLIRDDGPFVTGSNISGGANNMAIGTAGSGGFLQLYTNNTERLRITSGGDVGIGTASPTGTTNRFLNIYGVASNELHLTNATTGNASTDGFTILQSGNDIYQYNYEAGFLELGTSNTSRLRIFANGRIGVNTTTDAGYQFDINGTLRSVNGANFATTSGNVGIGTASPLQKLGVAGNGQFNVASGSVFVAVSSGASNSLQIATDASNNYLYGTGAIPLTFSTNGSEKMRISSDGELLIGTTTDAGAYALQVAGSIYNTTGAVLAASSGNVGVGTASPQRKVVSEVVAANDFNYAATSANLGVIGNWVGYLYGFAGNTYQKGATFFESIDGNARGKFHIAMNDAATSANVTLSDARLTVTSAGNVGIGTASPSQKLDVAGITRVNGGTIYAQASGTESSGYQLNAITLGYDAINAVGWITAGGAAARTNLVLQEGSGGELLIGTKTDAGDYKLQVVGNARVGTGKLDISSNTTFSMNVQRSGTSEVAGTFNNSNGILYLGAESSAGGAIFTGSSSYAAVIGSGANYPLQFATNNVTRATINTNGELLINTTTDNGDFKLQVNGNALISGSIKTANGASSTAQPWHLGSVVATNVQLDTANYVEVEINGVYYRLAIVTPL
jgi:hypothetical protein